MPKLNRTTGRTTHSRRRAIQNTDAAITRARGSKAGLLSLFGAKPKTKAQKKGKGK